MYIENINKNEENEYIYKISSLIFVNQRKIVKSVYGDALLIEDKKYLDKQDLSKIMKIAFNIDFRNNSTTITIETSDDIIHKSVYIYYLLVIIIKKIELITKRIGR